MSFNPFSVIGKNVIVTGASSGIGQEVAIALSKLGAKVFLLGRNRENLIATKKLCYSPKKHVIFDFDLLDADARLEFIKSLKEHVSEVDALVHCAGISSTSALRSLSEEKLTNHFNINVNSGLLLIKELVAKKNSFLREGSSIVMMSSVMATVGEVGKTAYAMTKGAILAGVKSLSLELAIKKIRVNAISPGVITTPMSSDSFYSKSEDRLEKIKALHPLGLGKPSDVANACVYLVSDASQWVTGTNMIIDGGYTAR
jgi:NAD(P)-dependent dehydrogenase (short-subunit alcohol dehydrogenase family)